MRLIIGVAQSGNGPIIDAYCGIGTISLPLASEGLQVVGIEINPDSIAQAQANAAANELQGRTRFVAGDVATLLQAELRSCAALVVDPPRRGLAPEVVEAILADPPPLLALSCECTQSRTYASLTPPVVTPWSVCSRLTSSPRPPIWKAWP